MFARKNRAQPEPILNITGWFLLDDGRYCEYGNAESGLGVDVYEDQSRQKLLSHPAGVRGLKLKAHRIVAKILPLL